MDGQKDNSIGIDLIDTYSINILVPSKLSRLSKGIMIIYRLHIDAILPLYTCYQQYHHQPEVHSHCGHYCRHLHIYIYVYMCMCVS